MRGSPALYLTVIVAAYTTFSENTISYSQYESSLTSFLQKEQGQKEQIAREQASIEDLKQKISSIDQSITSLQQEKLTLLGVTEQDVAKASGEASSLNQALQLFLAIPAAELQQRITEIDNIQTRLDALKGRKVALLKPVAAQITEAESAVAQVREILEQARKSAIEEQQQKQREKELAAQEAKQRRLALKEEKRKTRINKMSDEPAAPDNVQGDTYIVKLVPGDRETLHKIAETVYGGKTQWIKIYEANKDMIDKGYSNYIKSVSSPKYQNPQDFIYPGQVLKIPR